MATIFMALPAALSSLLSGSHVVHCRKVPHCVHKNNRGNYVIVKGCNSKQGESLVTERERVVVFFACMNHQRTLTHRYRVRSCAHRHVMQPGGMTSAPKELLISPNDCPTTWKHQVADCSTIMTSATDHPISTTNGHKRSRLYVSLWWCPFMFM